MSERNLTSPMGEAFKHMDLAFDQRAAYKVPRYTPGENRAIGHAAWLITDKILNGSLETTLTEKVAHVRTAVGHDRVVTTSMVIQQAYGAGRMKATGELVSDRDWLNTIEWDEEHRQLIDESRNSKE